MNNIAAVIKKREDYKKTHQLYYYSPYPFQRAFHSARDGQTYEANDYGHKMDELDVAIQRALISANQVGKTYSAAMETAMHLTGEYPVWWDGIRFTRPVRWLVVGKTNDTTRDVCQKELFGDPKIPSQLGTGAVPKHLIVNTKRKPGVPDAFMSATVKHVSGGISTVQFMASEQGPDAFMGRTYDGAWPDEEPHKDVWAQILRCFFSREFYTIIMTFTPEMGMTQVVDGFLNDLQKGQAVVRATWDDAPHMTEERKQTFLAQLMPHERDMRSRGIPLMGSGLVWPISEDDIVIEPIAIPRHWRKICGIDFGVDHPFAAVWVALDPDNDTIHIYGDYAIRGATPPVHASAIRPKGEWIPIAWPHDGLARDKGSGVPLADIYRKQEHLNLLRDKFSNPPGPGQVEGQGGNGVEVGIVEMWQRMESGRLKVHSTCQTWLSEFRQYHRKDGVIVALKDDCLSASRYAIQSMRFASTQPMRRAKVVHIRGASNW
jgi:phage terminase large subunit-like protein